MPLMRPRFSTVTMLLAVVLASGFTHALTLPAARPINAGWQLGPFVKDDAANPVLAPAGSVFTCPIRQAPVAWEKDNVFNPAAVVRDGKVHLLYRAEDDSGSSIGTHTSRIGLAVSDDARRFQRRAAPVLHPAPDRQKDNEWPGGCEDPRIVEAADGRYILTYTEWNQKTARLAVATSRDLVHWTKHGPVFAQADGGRFRDLWSKSGAIVTRRSGDHLIATHLRGRYWMYWGDSNVYASTSIDLIHWKPVVDRDGRLVPVMSPRARHFDSSLVEPGPPAVLTRRGILLLYNGRNAEANGDPSLRPGTYSAGQALMDPKQPMQVLARGDSHFLTPEKPYERKGQYADGTVFIEGLVHWGGRWRLYYGTADSHIAVATCEDDGL